MRRAEIRTCEICGGLYHEIDGKRYPVYNDPTCTCLNKPEDANEAAARVVRDATEGR